MARFTLYNILTSTPLADLVSGLEDRLGSSGWELGEVRDGEDGSKLALVARSEPSIELGLWVVPLEEGQFQPPAFDRNCDPHLVEDVRAVCKVGAREGPTPAETVRWALALSGEIAGQGRVYDMHAQIAYSPEEAREATSRPFDVMDYVTYHYLAPPSGDAAHSWLHLHGMAKFASPDLEAFDVHPSVSHKALALLKHIADRLATTREPQPETVQSYGHASYRLRWSRSVRPTLAHFSEEDFDEFHQGTFLMVEDAGDLASLDQLLRGAYEMEPKTQAECAAEQRVWQERLETIREGWHVRGSDMFMVRAALTVGPEDEVEHIWVSVETWEGEQLQGTLLNDAYRDPSLQRGKPIAFDETLISGVSLARGQDVLSEVETLRKLEPESAALLDAALKPARSGLRAEQGRSPDGAHHARYVDDGRVAYLQVNAPGGDAPLVGPIWLYNRLKTPPLIDLRPEEEGLLPLMSQVYTDQRDPDQAPEAKRIDFEWGDGVVTLLLDAEPWARIDIAQRVGWSRLITLPNRYGRPWSERRGAGAVQGS